MDPVVLGIVSSTFALLGPLVLLFGILRNADLLHYKLDNIYLVFFLILQQFILLPESNLLFHRLFGFPIIFSTVWIWRTSIVLGIYGVSLYIYRLNDVISTKSAFLLIIMFIGGAAAGGVATSFMFEEQKQLSEMIFYDPFIGGIITVVSVFILSVMGFLSILTYYLKYRPKLYRRYSRIVYNELWASFFFLIGSIIVMIQRTLLPPFFPFNFFTLWWGLTDLVLGVSLFRLPCDSTAFLLSIRSMSTQEEILRVNLKDLHEDPNLMSTVLFGAGTIFKSFSQEKVTTIFEGTKARAIVSMYKDLVGTFHLEGKGCEKDEIALYLFLKQIYRKKPKSIKEYQQLIDIYLTPFFESSFYTKEDYVITLFNSVSKNPPSKR